VTNDHGWVTTFAFTQKTAANPAKAHQASSFGTVTNTTTYGTSTESFIEAAGTAAPWKVVNGNVVVDPYSNNADTLFNATWTMVTEHGGQNAAYSFPTA
jgi:hypothetical protein